VVALVGGLLTVFAAPGGARPEHPGLPTTTTIPPSPPTTAPAPPPSMLLVGDSVADTLRPALADQAAIRGIRFSAQVRPGCGLTTGTPAYPNGTVIPWGPGCADDTIGYLSGAVQQANPQVVVWFSTWETADQVVNGQFYEFGTPAADALLLEELEQSREILTAGGARLVMVTVAPRAEHSATVPDDNPAEDQQYLHLDDLLRAFASQHTDSVTVVDLAKIVCPSGPPCPVDVDGVDLRPNDGGHFAGDGPAWVAPRLMDAIMRELRPAPQAIFR
jgi:hypothetical protein